MNQFEIRLASHLPLLIIDLQCLAYVNTHPPPDVPIEQLDIVNCLLVYPLRNISKVFASCPSCSFVIVSRFYALETTIALWTWLSLKFNLPKALAIHGRERCRLDGSIDIQQISFEKLWDDRWAMGIGPHTKWYPIERSMMTRPWPYDKDLKQSEWPTLAAVFIQIGAGGVLPIVFERSIQKESPIAEKLRELHDQKWIDRREDRHQARLRGERLPPVQFHFCSIPSNPLEKKKWRSHGGPRRVRRAQKTRAKSKPLDTPQ